MLLHYQQIVKSPTADWLVFFHGMGGNCSIFYKQIPVFQEHYNLLLIDLPGHGQSGAVEEQLPVEFAAEKVLELLRHLGIGSAHFMGVSLGTMVMQYIALLEPGRIKSMVLAGAVLRLQPWGERLVKLSRSFPLRHLLPARWSYILFAHILLPRRNHRTSRSLFIQTARDLKSVDYHAWVGAIIAAERTYAQLEQRRNTVPKLYVSGSEDHMFLPPLRDFVARESHATHVVLPACGHVCNIESADRFNGIALSFLGKHAGPRLPARRYLSLVSSNPVAVE